MTSNAKQDVIRRDSRYWQADCQSLENRVVEPINIPLLRASRFRTRSDEYFYVIDDVYGNDEKTVGINVHMVIEESRCLETLFLVDPVGLDQSI